MSPKRLPEPEVASKPRALIGATLLVSLGISAAALALFAALAEEVFEGDAARFDHHVRAMVHSLAGPALTSAMLAISFLGSPVFLASLFVALILIFVVVKWLRAALWFAAAMAGALVLDVTLKLLFHRVRPMAFFGAEPHSYSFPSGHALGSFCFYGVLAGLLAHRISSALARIALWTSAGLLITAIGFSRIYLGVHYPTDVVAGYLAGTVWVTALMIVDQLRTPRRHGVSDHPEAPQ